MTREIHILPQAARSLEEIAIWSRRRFGDAQTRAYRGLFQAKFAQIARETAANRSLENITGKKRHRAIRITISGSHHVMYVERDDVIIILDIVHQKRDLGGLDFSEDSRGNT